MRIDDGEVEDRVVGLSPRGNYIQIVAPESFVMDRVRNSSRLRVEVSLLDGSAFVEFNTKGAESAITNVRCPLAINSHASGGG